MNFLQWSCIALFVCINTSIHAQEKGIQWATDLSWQEIMQKAKAENKYIFLDCFATWCSPCYRMDREVYRDKFVGDIINQKFISVKVQMDRTGKDNDFVKSWYNNATSLQRKFDVIAFPTLIFLAPNGAPLHRAIGFHNTEDFIVLTKDALNPDKQYYTLAKAYVPGKFDTSELKGLARALKNSGGELPVKFAYEYLTRIPKFQLGDKDNINLMCEFRGDSLMQLFVSDYFKTIPRQLLSDSFNLLLVRNYSTINFIRDSVLGYLSKLNITQLAQNLSLLAVFKNDSLAKPIADRYINSLLKKEMYLEDNIYFLADFTNESNDRGFKFFYNNSAQVDKIMGTKGFGISLVLNIIVEEEYMRYYADAIKKASDQIPWKKIANAIKRKYGLVIADRLDLYIKAALYGELAKKEDKYWPSYIDNYIQSVEKYELDTTVLDGFRDATMLNNFVYNVILFHSDNANHIATGLKWMEGVIRRNPDPINIDTYANLLYKANRKMEAIQWQEKAIQIAIEQDKNWNVNEFKSNLEKMRKGESTWILQNKN